MTALDLALDLVQFAALLALSVANGVIAYSVFKIQRDRNTPKLAVYVELVEDDGHDYWGLYLQNVGLVPALNVGIVADIEEWREGRRVESKFHERYDRFQDHHVSLGPQEYRLYELPGIEGWGLIITAVASCSNGPSYGMHFAVGDDRSALREVALGKSRKKAIKELGSRASSKGRRSGDLQFVMGLTSLKDYDELFGEKAEDP